MHYCERTKWSNSKNFIFDYYNMSSNIIEAKKQKNKANRKSSNTNVFTLKNLKKVSRVTMKVFISIAMLFLGGSIFWHYGIICHAGLLQTNFPEDYYDRKYDTKTSSTTPPPTGFDKIKILKTRVPIYSVDDDNNTTRCSFIHFDEADINKQFEGTVNDKGKRENASLLYKLTKMREGAETKSAGFIKYSFSNYVQRLIIADFKIISTYFEFFHSLCSESVGLMLGALFLIPFAPIYIICHVASSIGLFLMSIIDIFKTGRYIEKKEAPTVGGWLWNLFYPLGDDSTTTPEYEPLTWGGLFIRIIYFFFYCMVGTIVGSISSIFCALYSLVKAFSMSGTIDVTKTSVNSKTQNSAKTKQFTISDMYKNNLHFYSRGYLIAFTLMLIKQIYQDMSPTTAIGCIFAVIILVFGTNVFAKYVVDPDDFSSSGDQCDASTVREPDAPLPQQNPDPSAPPISQMRQNAEKVDVIVDPVNTTIEVTQSQANPSAPPISEMGTKSANIEPLETNDIKLNLNDSAEIRPPEQSNINQLGGMKQIKKSSSKTQRKKTAINVAPQ